MNFTERPSRRFVCLLASMPAFDCVINQVNTAFHISFGSLSLLQVIRFPLLVVFAGISIHTALFTRKAAGRLPFVAPGAFVLVMLLVLREFLQTGSVALSSLGAYGQLLYWVVFWSCLRVCCRSQRDAEVVLRGMVVAGLLSTASIFLGYAVGGLNPYADDGVAASAGWFNTAKTITGVLLTSACVLLYFGRTSRSYLYPVLAILCCAGCMVTFARAGQVALAFTCLWLVIWSLTKRQSVSSRIVVRFLAMGTLLGLLALPAVLRSNNFINRWQDVADHDKGGSGRAAFWRVAISEYSSAKPADLVFGFGYNQMANMLYKDYGADIRHTHNDFLDVMLIGGACGICWWVALMATLLMDMLSFVRTYEGMAGLGIFIVFASQGQLTGQLLGTDAMVAYSLGITCLGIIGRLQRRQSQPSQLKIPQIPTEGYDLKPVPMLTGAGAVQN